MNQYTMLFNYGKHTSPCDLGGRFCSFILWNCLFNYGSCQERLLLRRRRRREYVSLLNFNCRPVSTFLHVSASTLCRTRLSMFTSTCSHQMFVVTRALFILFYFFDFVSTTAGAHAVFCSHVYSSIQIVKVHFMV